MPAVRVAVAAMNDVFFVKNCLTRRNHGSDEESEFTIERKD